ncbi:hypothetical protein P8847_20070 [Bacillus inaquosorum]|nr:hypothetical protein [Bacillus inaquosorum]
MDQNHQNTLPDITKNITRYYEKHYPGGTYSEGLGDSLVFRRHRQVVYAQ